MSGVFDDVKLNWEGRTFTVPSNRIMGAIMRIEDVITLHELKEYAERGSVPFGKIASAYGAVLRYAGCQVTDEEVYRGMFQGGGDEVALAAVVMLLELMVPRADVDLGEPSKGNVSTVAVSSSGRRTRRRSAKSG